MHQPKTTGIPGVGPNDRTGFRRGDLLILTLAATVLFGVMIGNRPLSSPDEGRYVEIPREMVASGNWLTPRLNDVKYFEKPPLLYWFEACLIKLFGLSEWAVRLGPALFALVGCIAVYFAGVRLFGRRAGILAAVILSTSVLYYALSRLITLDMPVTVLLTSSLLSFLIGTREPEGFRRQQFFRGFYAFAALAVLTKGLIGIVIPGMVIGAWMLVMKEWRVLKSMHIISGLIIFILIAAPWHILINRANPEFFDFYFIHEHFQRYLTKIHGRYKPAWYFIPILAAGLLPWSVFLVQSVRHALPLSWQERHVRSAQIFLLLWAGIVFVFFSASSSKLIPYILPVLPPLALLIGNYLAEAWVRRGQPGIRAGYAALLFISVLIATGLLILSYSRFGVEIHGSRHLFSLTGILVVGVAIAVILANRYGFRQALVSLILCTALFLTAGDSIMPLVDSRSVKEIALELKPRLRPGDEVVNYRTYYQDLPVYLERRITLVEWTGELAFGSTVEDTSGWMIDGAKFRRRWRDPSRTVYMLTDLKNYEALRVEKGLVLFPLARNRRTILLSNRELKS